MTQQSVLHPAGPEAAAILDLFWVWLTICVLVWLAVIAVLMTILIRRRSLALQRSGPTGDRGPTVAVGLAGGLTGLIVIALTVVSYSGQSVLVAGEAGETLDVVGHQWWWEVGYGGAHAGFATANEIHVPVGEPVTIRLTSADVIHSFWAPNVMGKLDLIPGKENALTFTVDKPGTYRGQCAEFCGLQHAQMGLLVLAEPRAAFDAWRATQSASAAEPATAEARAGRDVFLAKPCAGCHSIRGTAASGATGPDLTHLASRTTIAGGALPFTRGALAAWIADPQAIKPGSKMPRVPLTPNELNVLLDYLEQLR